MFIEVPQICSTWYSFAEVVPKIIKRKIVSKHDYMSHQACHKSLHLLVVVAVEVALLLALSRTIQHLSVGTMPG